VTLVTALNLLNYVAHIMEAIKACRDIWVIPNVEAKHSPPDYEVSSLFEHVLTFTYNNCTAMVYRPSEHSDIAYRTDTRKPSKQQEPGRNTFRASTPYYPDMLWQVRQYNTYSKPNRQS
jgi:hypothetical protein